MCVRARAQATGGGPGKSLNLALALLKSGLARLQPNMDPLRLANGSELLAAQQAAKEARLKVCAWGGGGQRAAVEVAPGSTRGGAPPGAREGGACGWRCGRWLRQQRRGLAGSFTYLGWQLHSPCQVQQGSVRCVAALQGGRGWGDVGGVLSCAAGVGAVPRRFGPTGRLRTTRWRARTTRARTGTRRRRRAARRAPPTAARTGSSRSST